MIDITKALSIEGWMSPEELRWLAERAQEHQVIVEIGSYLGRSTRALADHTPGVVYAIDDWYGPRDVDWLTPEQRETCYTDFLKNINPGRTYPINKDHAAATVPEVPDMVFIDGDHEYASVRRDIDLWLPRLAPGGLLCGHDAGRPDVIRAVKETFELVVAPETTIWWTRKQSTT